MLLDPPTEVSQDHINIDVREIEPLLQGPAMNFTPWPGAMIELKDGRTLYIREATLDEAPDLMGYMKQSDGSGPRLLRRRRRSRPR